MRLTVLVLSQYFAKIMLVFFIILLIFEMFKTTRIQ